MVERQKIHAVSNNHGDEQNTMTTELKCTKYAIYDGDDPNWYPCNCPVCGGFLKWEGDKPICNKCHVELLAIPEHDEETGEELDWAGKICPISMPKKKSGVGNKTQ